MCLGRGVAHPTYTIPQGSARHAGGAEKSGAGPSVGGGDGAHCRGYERGATNDDTGAALRAVHHHSLPCENLMMIVSDHLDAIAEEYRRTKEVYPNPMHSTHQAYAVLLEEVDEMWDAIKANDVSQAKKEAVQVAAVALAFLLEIVE